LTYKELTRYTVHINSTILKDPNHPHFMKALEFAATRGYGKETDRIEGRVNLARGVMVVPPRQAGVSWRRGQASHRDRGGRRRCLRK